MKKLLGIFLLALGASLLIAANFNPLHNFPEPNSDCPPTGSTRPGSGKKLSKEWQTTNKKKNKSAAVPAGTPEVLSIKQLLGARTAVKDSDYWWEGAYVEINDAYLIDSKTQGGESCNCYEADTDKEGRGDIHINIGTKKIMQDGNNNYYMVVEITPSYKAKNPDYSALLKSLKGKKVSIRGYLFYDWEHQKNSINYCKTCSEVGVWRKTCWEIHPVTFIGASE